MDLIMEVKSRFGLINIDQWVIISKQGGKALSPFGLR
jgi:hypothetical protein